MGAASSAWQLFGATATQWPALTMTFTAFATQLATVLCPGVWWSQISCAWGFTTSGGAKGVGESTTSAVVISLVAIFVADFILSYVFYQVR